MSLHVYADVEQRSDEWVALRRGIVTASTVGQLITPSTLKVASNDKSRALIWSLAAERINGWSDDTYQSADMLRGVMDEPVARAAYAEHTRTAVTDCGFMDRDFDGHRLGYSPDGLVDDSGLVEIKSGKPREHLRVVVGGEVPAEHMAQIQAGLLVSGRAWCDYVRIASGMALWIKRVLPDPQWHVAILAALDAAETGVTGVIATYRAAVEGLPVTERTDYFPEIEF